MLAKVSRNQNRNRNFSVYSEYIVHVTKIVVIPMNQKYKEQLELQNLFKTSKQFA